MTSTPSNPALKDFNVDCFAGKEQFLEFKFGKLILKIKKFAREFHVQWSYGDLTDKPTSSWEPFETTPDKNMLKWVTAKDTEKFQFHPALPDKSLVLKSIQPLKIPPKINTRFYILVPIFVQITRAVSSKELILEKSSLPISQSWFGDMDSGELGYHQPSSFYQELKNLSSKYYQAICPISVHNQSGVELVFDKFLLESRLLNLYSTPDSIWTNELHVTYEEDKEFSKVKIQQSPPKESGATKPLVPSRDKYESGLVKNTFERIKKITGT